MTVSSCAACPPRPPSPPPPPPPPVRLASSPVPSALTRNQRSLSAPPDMADEKKDVPRRYFPRNIHRRPTPIPTYNRGRSPSPATSCWEQRGQGGGGGSSSLWLTLGGGGGGSSSSSGTTRGRVSLATKTMLQTLSGGGGSSSGGSNHSRHRRRSMGSLFHVKFPSNDQELEHVQEFERIDSSLKQEIWYFTRELKQLLAREMERNRKYELGEPLVDNNDNDNYENEHHDDEPCCWRGLEHVLEGDDRSLRIRTTVSSVVHWYQEAKQQRGYHDDPEELRVISKTHTKQDRVRARKRAAMDAQYLKKLYKQQQQQSVTPSSSPSSSYSTPKKMVQRISKTFTPPKLHWSPKPNKKETATAVLKE
jgi:hypothetical protein